MSYKELYIFLEGPDDERFFEKIDYIFFRDINNSLCITFLKEKLKKKYKIRDINKIVIIKHEIESWYLAGINENDSKKFKIKYFKKTDNIIKEKFNKIIPSKFNSRIDFMIEILKYFSIEEAIKRNESFKYFYEKYLNKMNS